MNLWWLARPLSRALGVDFRSTIRHRPDLLADLDEVEEAERHSPLLRTITAAEALVVWLVVKAIQVAVVAAVVVGALILAHT